MGVRTRRIHSDSDELRSLFGLQNEECKRWALPLYSTKPANKRILTGPRTRATLRRRHSSPPSEYKSHHEHMGIGDARDSNMDVCLYVASIRFHLYGGP